MTGAINQPLMVLRWSFERPELSIPWHSSAIIRHVGVKDPAQHLPDIWVEYPTLPTQDRLRLVLVGTGHRIDLGPYSRYVGTAVCAAGELVWHVYEALEEFPS